jgi:hypothetical protein
MPDGDSIAANIHEGAAGANENGNPSHPTRATRRGMDGFWMK